jgi:hypothetical protein
MIHKKSRLFGGGLFFVIVNNMFVIVKWLRCCALF